VGAADFASFRHLRLTWITVSLELSRDQETSLVNNVKSGSYVDSFLDKISPILKAPAKAIVTTAHSSFLSGFVKSEPTIVF
jgi:hypothetical protein